MIHAAYALPDAEPLDGPDLCSTYGWYIWCNYVLTRADQYPEAAHLAAFGWSDKPEDLDHDLAQVLHGAGDPDLAAITTQIVAALRAAPSGAVFYATDGEPAGDEEATESVADLPDDPLGAILTEARTARKDGDTWQVNGNWYTKQHGKIRKTSDPSKKKAGKQPTKKDQRKAAAADRAKTLADRRAKAKTAADKLAAGGKDLSHEDVAALDDHFSTLTREQMRDVAKKIGGKIGGLKKDLAARLITEAKARAAGNQAPPAQKPEPPPESPTHPVQMKLVAALNDSPKITDEEREKYGQVLAGVLKSMPKAALDRVEANLDGVTFHPSAADIGQAMIDQLANQPGLDEDQRAFIRAQYDHLKTKRIGGVYMGGFKHVHVDGDNPLPKGATVKGRHGAGFADARGIHGHEITHAIDGPEHEISKSPEWDAAFKSEIARGEASGEAEAEPPLTAYAATKPSEGLAEFGRLVYASDVPHAEIEKQFPKCTSIWKARGLWPTGDQVRTAPTKQEAVEPVGTAGPASRESGRRLDSPAGGAARLPEVFSHAVDLGTGGAHADILLDPTDPAAVAYALALLRSEGDDEAAAELLHMIGDSDVDEETTESVVREEPFSERGPPPFEGAVFDDTSHRWKLPGHDAKDETGAHPAETKAKSLAARIKEVPKALVTKVGTWVKAKHDKLAARYGSKGAKAVLGAMILLAPTPVPGSSLIPIALAEAVLRVVRAVSGKKAEAVEPVELSAEEVERIARQLLAELEKHVKG